MGRANRYKAFIVLVLIVFVMGNSLTIRAKTIDKESRYSLGMKQDVISSTATGRKTTLPLKALDAAINKNTAASTKKITYGPYNEDNLNSDHAYEPFKQVNDKTDASKGYAYRKDRLLVKYKDNVTKASDGTYTVKGKSLSLNKQGIKSLESVLPEKKASASSSKMAKMNAQLSNWNKAYLAKGKDINTVMKDLKKDPNVKSVEYDYIRKVDATQSSSLSVNDPNANQQWHLDDTGVKQAWDYLQSQGINPGGSRDVVVAVIDTGVDYNHPDLKGNMWVNTGEIPGNGIDDDHNGYVDDIYGASTVSNQPSGNPNDDNGHGTHVAGIIAAQGNNGIGGTGIAFNTRIMAIKAAQSSGVLSSSDVAQAIYYAVDKGADVINMSFGGYGESTVEADALQVAFGTSVLVASAGNDSTPNLPHPDGADMYPAAYNWVLGVMAEKPAPSANGDYLANFSNWDYVPQDSHEYEVMAPGVDIYSTLPNGKYAKWSGTSMAAPVVSGIAALVRSKYADKDSYSSRFIMGQIAETGQSKQGITYDPKQPPLFYKDVNALGALTDTPKPSLSYLEDYMFDSTPLASENNGDGVIDAGETVDLAMVIRNQWGKADNVKVKIDTNSAAEIADPYVTLLQDTVDYGAVGTFAQDDNGLIYENGVVTGVNTPFKLKVAANTPNDHVVPINVTITAKNGLDSQDTQTYSFQSSFSFSVRNGSVLPSVIDKDMTLTKDKYWIIPRATLIEKGATVTVEPGTQIQFWSSDPVDPYAQQQQAYLQVEGKFLVNGTADEPVEMFNSSMYPGYEVKIESTNKLSTSGMYTSEELSGYSEFNYAKITNPNLAVNKIDHSYFTQELNDQMYKAAESNGNITFNWGGPFIHATEISNTRFEKLGYKTYPDDSYNSLKVSGKISNSLFDSCVMNGNNYLDSYGESNSDITALTNSVFLKNGRQGSYVDYMSSRWAQFGYNVDSTLSNDFTVENYQSFNGHSYFSTSLQGYNGLTFNQIFEKVKKFAELMGGYVVTINDEQENNFIKGIFPSNSIIGLNDWESEGNYQWVNKDSVDYTSWAPGQPNNSDWSSDLVMSGYNGWETVGKYAFYNKYPIIIEIPEIKSYEDLTARRDAIQKNGELKFFSNNAFLNDWNDPNTNHWMKFDTVLGRNYTDDLSQNYWGASDTLIDKAITDYNDDFNKAKIVYKPKLETAPETSYPFVTDLYVSTETQQRAAKVGAEPVQIHVLFNRDMDQGKQPQVSFGPSMPMTDYMVNGSWVSPREWVGNFNISPLTGDGYQYFRVTGAVAADDPWLVTGNDTERFGFEIVTSGTEAMNLQASGEEGKVHLGWSQDDFDTLAGYNVYRSETKDDPNSYTKINQTVIPADTKYFDDTNVTPGKMYYYKFRVVKTDLTESSDSNIASAAPVDTIAPVITHTPVQQAKVGQQVQIYADVTDNVKVNKVTLYYKTATDISFKQKDMVNTTGSRYSTVIDGSTVVAPWIDYYIEATDGTTLAQSGNQNQPYRISVSDKPTITSVTPSQGSELGGTQVVINGSNFKQGASILFGQAVASNVVVVNGNQITAVTPAHYPAKVDVTVNNPDGTTGVALSGYTFTSEGKEVSISNVTGNVGDLIDVPVFISNVSGLRSADFKVKFDSNLLAINSVKLGNITKNFSLASNTNTNGEVQLSMASPTAVDGSGSVAVITFKVLNSQTTSSPLTLDQLSFNSGSIQTIPVNGTFSISQTYSVQGNVRYYSNYKPVDNVLLQLLGIQNYQGNTDVNGYFALSGIKGGNYTLKASKSDGVNGISSYDASLILQYSAGLITLNDQQKIAADVDGNGQINALDAAYVLEKSVDLLSLPFPGAGKVWTFTQGDRTYQDLSSDQSYQDYTAILLGDVNGDWGDTATNMSSLYKVGATTVQSDGKLTAPVTFNVGDADLYSAKISVTYDPTQVKPSEVVKSDSIQDYSLVFNTDKEGVIDIAVAGTKPLQGTGKLVDIKFDPIVKKLKTPSLQLTNGNMNDQNIVVTDFKADKATNQGANTKVKWTADALGDGLTYSWALYQGTNVIEKQGYSKVNYFESTLKKTGNYRVLLMVKDKNGKVVSQFSDDMIIKN